MTVELWTLEGTDQDHEDVIAILRMALGVAQEAEIVHPETISALRSWCSAEYKRLHPTVPATHTSREDHMLASLRRSPRWPFWEALEAGQEVRWADTKTATYFVVDPRPSFSIPDAPTWLSGVYIELRRHTGKTFWTHIAKVLPLPEEAS